MSFVSIRNLSVSFPAGAGFARAVKGIDLDIASGETLGIVGESGCGKSVTWLAALGLLGSWARVSGQVRLRTEDILGLDDGRLSAVRGRQIAMIFQDPASCLNPVHTVGRQIAEALATHRGLSGSAIRAEALRLIDGVGIADAPRRLGQYPHEFSGGMNQRVMIAMALAGEPDLLIADEPTTALDVTIQAQILDLLRTVQERTGMALVLISHDLGVVSELCERIVVMYAGRIVEEAPVRSLFGRPAHPYTQGLLAAMPDLEGPRRRLVAIPGTLPAISRETSGCAFAPRCPLARFDCEVTLPPLGEPVAAEHDARHRAACLRIEEAESLLFLSTAGPEAVAS